jgi:hypothetical protein
VCHKAPLQERAIFQVSAGVPRSGTSVRNTGEIRAGGGSAHHNSSHSSQSSRIMCVCVCVCMRTQRHGAGFNIARGGVSASVDRGLNDGDVNDGDGTVL